MDIKEGCLYGLHFFDQKSAGTGVNMHANNEKLADKLDKPIITKF